MNTPDTEWETEFDENYNQVTLWNGLGYGNVHTKLKSFIIRTCVAEWNKGFEKGRSEYLDKAKDIDEAISSRDTYWKERVENTRTALLFIGEKVLKEMSEIYAVDIKYADKKQWLEPSEFERIFLHRFNEAGLKALDQLLDNLK